LLPETLKTETEMKILMVCLGNICRSPLAEGIMKAKAPENFVIDSAGTISMHEGNILTKEPLKPLQITELIFPNRDPDR
jgi:protein-tyrosine phosphatase